MVMPPTDRSVPSANSRRHSYTDHWTQTQETKPRVPHMPPDQECTKAIHKDGQEGVANSLQTSTWALFVAPRRHPTAYCYLDQPSRSDTTAMESHTTPATPPPDPEYPEAGRANAVPSLFSYPRSFYRTLTPPTSHLF